MGNSKEVENILADNGFKTVLAGDFATGQVMSTDASVKVGDVIVYRESNTDRMSLVGQPAFNNP